MKTASPAENKLLAAASVLALAISAWRPFDRFTWWLEVAPVLIGLPLIWAIHRRFPLTPLLTRLLFIHAVILIVGGHYTYARVPLGFWIQNALGLGRNPYDRLGHLAQGFVPAILAREIFLRRRVVRPGGWLFFLAVCACLAFSALYEIAEWLTAAASGEAAEDFLGTQGDEWDTQWDMALALIGSVAALALLGRAHDRHLEDVGS